MPFSDREAQRGYQRKHYAANRPRLIAASADRKKQRQEQLRDYKRDLVCVRCGFSDWRALHFHHRDPSLKSSGVSQAADNGWRWERILEEIGKCDVLCANCHCIEHRLEK